MGIARDVAAEALGEVFGDLDERTLIARAIQKKLRGTHEDRRSRRTRPPVSVPDAAGVQSGGRGRRAPECGPSHGFDRIGRMRSREIRSSFLDYFRRQGHTIVASSSLVPTDDPTLLFTNAGMNQFKDTFLGKEKRAYTRATTSQKCMRVSGKHNDLDNVGPSLRHHTFFEMLGNFSFGDYFKKDAIPFAWELLTGVWKLPPARLYPTIFRGEAGIPRDDEAYDVWRALVPTDRIAELGAADNSGRWAKRGPAAAARRSTISAATTAVLPRGERRDLPRPRVPLRPLHRDLEQRLHGVRSPGGCDAATAARALDRYGHGPRARDRGHPGQALELRHRHLHADPEGDRRPGGPAVRGRGRRPVGRLDARHRGSPARDDLPHRRRRRALERVARLRAAEDHAPRHAPRQETRLHRPRPARARGRARRRDGRRLPGARARPRRHRPRRAQRRGAVRRGPDRRAPPPRGGARPRGGGQRILPGDEAFKLYDSLGVPLDFIEDLAGQRQIAIDREGYERAMEGQRVKARAGSSFKGKGGRHRLADGRRTSRTT